MPIITPRGFWEAAGLGDLSEDHKRLARARSVLLGLKSWKRQALPERPPLNVGEKQLVDWLRTVDRGDKLPRAEREVWLLFVSWRKAVWKKESEAVSRLVVLFKSIQTFEDLATTAADEDKQKLSAGAHKIRVFLASEWGVEPPEKLTDAVVLALSKFGAQDLKLLPRHLRDGKGLKQYQAEEPAQQSLRKMLTTEEAYDDTD